MILIEDLSKEVVFAKDVEFIAGGVDCASTDKATAVSSGSASLIGTAMACRTGAGSGGPA